MRALLPVLVACATLVSTTADADPSQNILRLLPIGEAANIATIEMTGSQNSLTVLQMTQAAANAGNSIEVSLTGARNGGGAPGGIAASPLIADLPWGRLEQSGEANVMDLAVAGDDNLLAAAQIGSANVLMAEIAGSTNRAAVSQTGHGNMAMFSQAGHGNLVSISQTSW